MEVEAAVTAVAAAAVVVATDNPLHLYYPHPPLPPPLHPRLHHRHSQIHVLAEFLRACHNFQMMYVVKYCEIN